MATDLDPTVIKEAEEQFDKATKTLVNAHLQEALSHIQKIVWSGKYKVPYHITEVLEGVSRILCSYMDTKDAPYHLEEGEDCPYTALRSISTIK